MPRTLVSNCDRSLWVSNGSGISWDKTGQICGSPSRRINQGDRTLPQDRCTFQGWPKHKDITEKQCCSLPTSVSYCWVHLSSYPHSHHPLLLSQPSFASLQSKNGEQELHRPLVPTWGFGATLHSGLSSNWVPRFFSVQTDIVRLPAGYSISQTNAFLLYVHSISFLSLENLKLPPMVSGLCEVFCFTCQHHFL